MPPSLFFLGNVTHHPSDVCSTFEHSTHVAKDKHQHCNYCLHVSVAVLHEAGGEAPSYGGREDSVGSQAEGNLS